MERGGILPPVRGHESEGHHAFRRANRRRRGRRKSARRHRSQRVWTGPGDKVRNLLDKDQPRIVLDMGDVHYVDSGGIGELVESFTAARHRGGAIKLLNVTQRLNDLLVITKLLNVFECFESEEEALDSFDRPLVAH